MDCCGKALGLGKAFYGITRRAILRIEDMQNRKALPARLTAPCMGKVIAHAVWTAKGRALMLKRQEIAPAPSIHACPRS
jgi:hypothetical protein